MSSKAVKPNKLVFKGDKDKKKKKRKHHHDSDARNDADALNNEGWVRADSLDDLVGPLFITHPSDPPICITTDKENRLLAYPLPELAENTKPEPVIVEQVIVGARLVGTTNSFTFKSCTGKYLGSDKFGVVTCDSEAISGQEEWNPAITEAGIAFQNVHGKYLMVDEIANGGFKIRADAEEVGFCEAFRVYCQARFKHKNKSEKKKALPAGAAEIDNIRKYQSWGAGRIHTTKEDERELKRARQEGRAAEAMLDRRAKVKADRYCK
ncbi:FRG1-like family-domain-containing protein [Radiomyces spectabilis]|uniref:FRG1-like family-domain-containing protein n=1 Tax=Radiomyces spectabilis TaxID=64574 RepID=UPI002220DDD0|nr:FRG1-like family-domain-containing protein [Radiomyces spectabilis]KAI8368123.1 FRG1-like family-domain-containing protein [Radiomyces spectabilis]